MNRHLLIWLLLPLLGCSGVPTGPGPGDTLSGTVYFIWEPEGATSNQVYRLDLPDGQPVMMNLGYHAVLSVAVDRNNRGLVAVVPGFNLLYWPQLDPARAEYLASGDIRHDPAINWDGTRVATIRFEPAKPAEVRVVDLDQHIEYSLGDLPDNELWYQLRWVGKGDSLLVSHDAGPRNLWYTLKDYTGALTRYPFEVTDAADEVTVSPDGKWLALSRPGDVVTGKLTNTIRVYSIATGGLELDLALPYPAFALEWSPDSRFLLHAPPVDTNPARPVLEVIDPFTGHRQTLIAGSTAVKSLNWTN